MAYLTEKILKTLVESKLCLWVLIRLLIESAKRIISPTQLKSFGTGETFTKWICSYLNK